MVKLRISNNCFNHSIPETLENVSDPDTKKIRNFDKNLYDSLRQQSLLFFSSEDEQVENTLEAFFGPSSTQSNPTSSKPNLTSLPVGSVAAEGDLDSRLANIFTPEEKKRKTSRWDTEVRLIIHQICTWNLNHK